MSSYSCFYSKNTCELDIVVTRTVNVLTTNELVKLTMLWTTGPRITEVAFIGMCLFLRGDLVAISLYYHCINNSAICSTVFNLNIGTTPKRACPIICTSPVYCLFMCLKITGWVANSVDPDLKQLKFLLHLIWVFTISALSVQVIRVNIVNAILHYSEILWLAECPTSNKIKLWLCVGYDNYYYWMSNRIIVRRYNIHMCWNI